MLQREERNLILDHDAHFLACTNYEKIVQQHFTPLYILVLSTVFYYLNTQVLTLSALIDAKASSFSLMANSWESLATDSLASISLDKPIKWKIKFRKMKTIFS